MFTRRRPRVAGPRAGLADLRDGLRLGPVGLDAHPQTPTILTTHEIVGRTTPASRACSDYGQQLWNKLIKKNDQIFLTLNGHYWPVGRMTMKNDFGHDVQLNLANYQDKYYGGAGMIRTYAFDMDRNTIDVSTFSPWVMNTPSSTAPR